ncbi:MAG TPA: hypothetical protein VLK84_27575 [Longimicrobium sp.]|nr:hypothetical protein [Longimicrobium sp.]
MAAKPTRWNRLVARVRRELPATDLDAYRRASLPVFELWEAAEARRQACRDEGLDAWQVPPATRTELACAWNAFVLQVLGNCILDADYQGDPSTKGFLPRGTAAQIRQFYHEVERWMIRTHQARSNPAYTPDIPLPVPLPRWDEDPHRSASHLAGLRHGMRAVRGHAEAALAALPEDVPGDARKQAQLARIRQAYAVARCRALHAEELLGAGHASPAHAFAEAYLRDAIERFYLLGQVLSDPALADGTDISAHRPVDLGAGKGATVVNRTRRTRRPKMGPREREHVTIASDERLPFTRRQDAVLEACRGRTPIAELIALYEWLEIGALREMLVFGLLSRTEPEAVRMMARIAREDPDPQVRHVARFWLGHSRHRDVPMLLATLPHG